MHPLIAGYFAIDINLMHHWIILQHELRTVTHQHGNFCFGEKLLQQFKCRCDQQNAANMARADGEDSPNVRSYRLDTHFFKFIAAGKNPLRKILSIEPRKLSLSFPGNQHNSRRND
jgi:hypothetical protein